MEIIATNKKAPTTIEASSQLNEVLNRWLSNHLSKGTQNVYGGTLKEFVWFLNEQRMNLKHPSNIKPQHIIKYRDWLLQRDQSNKTINRKISALSSMLKELRHEQIISINPAESIKRPPDDIKKTRSSFKDKEIKTLLDLYPENNSQGLQNKTILTLFAYTAQRVSTIRMLRVKDVKNIEEMMVLDLKIKGSKLRRLPIAHEPARLIRKILATKRNQEDYLFTAHKGISRGLNKPLSSVAIWYLIKNSLRKSGLNQNRSCHSFRRAVLTKLLNTDGVSPEKIREEISFHSSLATLGTYKMPTENKMTENPILGIVYQK